jgi:hypothetical protein
VEAATGQEVEAGERHGEVERDKWWLERGEVDGDDRRRGDVATASAQGRTPASTGPRGGGCRRGKVGGHWERGGAPAGAAWGSER